MEIVKQKRRILSLVIIAIVVIVSLIIGLSFHDNRNSIPMDAVSDNAGGFIALWHKNGGFYCQRIDSAGQAAWQKGGGLIASCTKYGRFDFQADGMGGAILTWSKASTSYYDPIPFYSQRINSKGELLWSDTLISSGDKWITIPNGDGGAIYAWDNSSRYIMHCGMTIFTSRNLLRRYKVMGRRWSAACQFLAFSCCNRARTNRRYQREIYQKPPDIWRRP